MRKEESAAESGGEGGGERVGERKKRLAGGVGRQPHAAPGKGRALLEMEIGHEQRLPVRQIHRPRQIEERRLALELDFVCCLFVLTQSRHAKASSRSAASASARISSALSL